MVLKKKQEQNEMIGETLGPAKKDTDPFLTLIEHKKRESKTPFFEDKNTPSKLDLDIFEDIKDKNV
jgi:hypothetical protein